MLSVWTQHLKDDEDKIRFRNSVLGSKLVLDRVREIIDELESEDDQSSSNYDSPNWAYQQADRIGAKRAYGRIRTLITTLET